MENKQWKLKSLEQNIYECINSGQNQEMLTSVQTMVLLRWEEREEFRGSEKSGGRARTLTARITPTPQSFSEKTTEVL